MQNILKISIEKLTFNPKNLFLIDSIGAFLSATFLFAILSFFEKKFGLPKKTLYLLFGIAGIFSIYSMCCFVFIGKQWRAFLRTISIANLLYCLLTIIFLVITHNSVTLLGLLYFILETIIISSLAYIELRTAQIGHLPQKTISSISPIEILLTSKERNESS